MSPKFQLLALLAFAIAMIFLENQIQKLEESRGKLGKNLSLPIKYLEIMCRLETSKVWFVPVCQHYHGVICFPQYYFKGGNEHSCVWTSWSIMSQTAAAFSFKQDPVSVLTHLVVQWIFSFVNIQAFICCTTSYCIRQNTETKTSFWINLFKIFGNIFQLIVFFACPLIWLNTVRYKSMSLFNYYKYRPIKKSLE